MNSRPSRKLFSSAESVLVRKDLSTIWSRKGLRSLLMIMPVILVMILPITYFAAISLLPESNLSAVPRVLREMIGGSYSTGRPFWVTVFTTFVCPVLYLIVPIVCAVASATCAFVNEKEQGTLETLFLSSMNAKSIFNAKITVCVLISVVISLISFLIFTITVSIADILIGVPFFFNLEWLVTVVLLMPVLCLFSVVFVSLILQKVHSMTESLQTMGYLILPFLILYLGQFAGWFQVSAPILLILAALLLVLAIVLFNFSARRFLAETLSE